MLENERFREQWVNLGHGLAARNGTAVLTGLSQSLSHQIAALAMAGDGAYRKMGSASTMHSQRDQSEGRMA